MFLRFLGDWLSPPRCAACNGALRASAIVFCAACAVSVERCHERASVAAYGEYGGALATSIRRLKYESCPHLARPLGSLLRHLGRESSLRADLVIPVPLHPRKLVERGYNQAALLAHHVAAEVRAPVVTRALARIVDTSVQAELSREARRANVGEAFRVIRPQFVERRSVLLVDDVATTGSTLAACEAALRDAGAGSVSSVVIARAMKLTSS